MSLNSIHDIETIVNIILDDYDDDRVINKTDLYNQPDKAAILDIVHKLFKIVYPGYYSDKVYKLFSIKNNLAATIEDVIYQLNKQIMIVLKNDNNELSEEELIRKTAEITLEFMEGIPVIREYLETDVKAAFDGDPAAGSIDEVIMSYPGVYATTVYRLAHRLYMLGVPMIPRIMTEHAHSVTGIDIHPGATIGKYFFMDHGTGIVIGETTIIGEHVKIYQGVTLGALSTKGGQKLKNVRRHPTIGDNVTIYSGASILGGETYIGDNSTIGGNAFITSSVDKDTKVFVKPQELNKVPGKK